MSAVNEPDVCRWRPDNPTFAVVGLPTNAGVDFVARPKKMKKKMKKMKRQTFLTTFEKQEEKKKKNWNFKIVRKEFFILKVIKLK